MFTLNCIHVTAQALKWLNLISEKMMVCKSLYMAWSLYTFKGTAWFTQIISMNS